jgi:hypothetical protein
MLATLRVHQAALELVKMGAALFFERGDSFQDGIERRANLNHRKDVSACFYGRCLIHCCGCNGSENCEIESFVFSDGESIADEENRDDNSKDSNKDADEDVDEVAKKDAAANKDDDDDDDAGD